MGTEGGKTACGVYVGEAVNYRGMRRNHHTLKKLPGGKIDLTSSSRRSTWEFALGSDTDCPE